MENVVPVERVKKILRCKHMFDSMPAKSPDILLLQCRECFIGITAEITAYRIDKEELTEE